MATKNQYYKYTQIGSSLCKSVIVMASALVAGSILVSCNDKVEYEAAMPDSADCMGVYFVPSEAYDFIFVPGEDSNISLTLKREKAQSAADVPLIFDSNVEGINCPKSVHFDAGSDMAEVSIDCSQMPVKTPATISVNLPDSYINHYAQTLFNYQATALMSQWVPANADGSPVTFYFVTSDYAYYPNPKVQSAIFQPVESEMEVLPGGGLLKVHNFINTGVDITFSLTPSPYSDFMGSYRLLPKNNYWTMNEVYESEAYGDSWYNPWYIYTLDADGEEDYASAYLTKLDGTEIEVEYPRFYSYSDSYAYEYSYAKINKGNSQASMGFFGSPTDNDTTIPDYFYVYFSWDGESAF